MQTSTSPQTFPDRQFPWFTGLWSPSSPAPASGGEHVTLWQRMRLNAAAVRPLLRDAGISADRVRTIRCGSCGLDDAGLARATLELTDEGMVRMGMRDRDGRERIRLGLLQDGSPGLTLSDREGRPRVVLGVLPDQTTNLVFADEAGRSRAVLGLTQDQAATLVFADRGGETRVGVGVDSQGQGGVTLYEQEAGPRPAEAVPDSVPTEAADSVVPPEP
jgi:hypothetical protein